jgi:hypothetical protein
LYSRAARDKSCIVRRSLVGAHGTIHNFDGRVLSRDESGYKRMSEKSFSKRIKKQIREAGFFVLDLESIGEGIPDCLVIKRHVNKCCFIEFKVEAGYLTKAQFVFLATEKELNVLIVQQPMNGEQVLKELRRIFK